MINSSQTEKNSESSSVKWNWRSQAGAIFHFISICIRPKELENNDDFSNNLFVNSQNKKQKRSNVNIHESSDSLCHRSFETPFLDSLMYCIMGL